MRILLSPERAQALLPLRDKIILLARIGALLAFFCAIVGVFMIPYAGICMKFTGPENGLEECIEAVPLGYTLCNYCEIFGFSVTNSTLTTREEVVGWLISVGATILLIIPLPASVALLLSTAVVHRPLSKALWHAKAWRIVCALYLTPIVLYGLAYLLAYLLATSVIWICIGVLVYPFNEVQKYIGQLKCAKKVLKNDLIEHLNSVEASQKAKEKEATVTSIDEKPPVENGNHASQKAPADIEGQSTDL